MGLLEKTLQNVGEPRQTIGVNDDDIWCGYNGTFGGLRSWPPTINTGYFEHRAVSNLGNFAGIVSNTPLGQATSWIYPDPANAIAQVMIGATATPFISGNFPMASGTKGLFVDSGVPAANFQPMVVNVTLTPAQIIAAYATPQVLIPAAAGKVAVLISANVYTASTGNTAFATGTAPIIQYGTTIHGAGTIATGAGLVTGDIEAAASQVRTIGPAASAVYTGLTNTAVTFSCATAYTAGTGTNVTFQLVYTLITATI